MQHIVRNNLFNPTFTITNCDDSPTNLSTATVKFMLKKTIDEPDSNSFLSGEYVNPDTNILQFEFTANETKNLPVGYAIMAVKVFRNGDKDSEIWTDECKITEGVFNG